MTFKALSSLVPTYPSIWLPSDSRRGYQERWVQGCTARFSKGWSCRRPLAVQGSQPRRLLCPHPEAVPQLSVSILNMGPIIQPYIS